MHNTLVIITANANLHMDMVHTLYFGEIDTILCFLLFNGNATMHIEKIENAS